MNDPTGEPRRAGRAADDSVVGERLVAEDLLLLLFQPGSGSIAGEGTLYYVLAGAVLAELGLEDVVSTTTSRIGTTTIAARAGARPDDALLRRAWDYIDGRPRGLQTVLAAVGPTLREPVLERLIARGDIRRVRRKLLGVIPTSSLIEGASGRRDKLLAEVRAVLVDGAEASPRVASLAALLYASGTLPQFDPVIPWGSRVIARAEELTAGEWGAAAAANAVARTLTVTIINSVIYANGPPRSR